MAEVTHKFSEEKHLHSGHSTFKINFLQPCVNKSSSDSPKKLLFDFKAKSHSVQFSGSVVSDSLQPHGLQHARPPCPSPTPGVYSNSCPLMISIGVHHVYSCPLVTPSNHLILCCPLLLSTSIFPSIRVFSSESALCIRWAKDWIFSFNISPYKKYLELISFGIDWFDLLAVQETLKSLIQHHSSKALILQHSAFFMVQL